VPERAGSPEGLRYVPEWAALKGCATCRSGQPWRAALRDIAPPRAM